MTKSYRETTHLSMQLSDGRRDKTGQKYYTGVSRNFFP